ncbi:peptidoglycan-binding domain-containing protein [Bacteroides sp. 224]|uniref:peptidoglycan-binding domain-containing protein n=1 Tax=Bacteroides sp. 224 TaxID=2302936 RepID=UPI0013D488A3|nr:peptidoglycan-binding domain-containing protein [Bacteroides sp. 224]
MQIVAIAKSIKAVKDKIVSLSENNSSQQEQDTTQSESSATLVSKVQETNSDIEGKNKNSETNNWSEENNSDADEKKVIFPCEQQVEVASLSIGTPATVATPKILYAKWKNKEKEDKKILEYKDKVSYIEIKTEGFSDGDKLTIEIKEDKVDAEIIKTLTIEIVNNELFTEDEGENSISIDENFYGKILIINVKSDKTELFIGNTIVVECCANCISSNSADSDLIKELNIRLAGFGENGNPLPEKKFTKKTENAVKQFQRDYMKIPQTGLVCKHFLEKLDEFCETYYIAFETEANFNVKCPCLTTKKEKGKDHKCTEGFGEDRASLASLNKNGPEKPGIHRSLLWTLSAMKFYLDKVETTDGIKLEKFSSVYRCIADNIREGRNTTNHMGNAVDMHFSGSSGTYISRADKVRELFSIYCGARIRWTPSGNNKFCMEPSLASYYTEKTVTKDDKSNPGKKIEETVKTNEFTATSWVHIDCREFNKTNYQKNEFYCKTESTLKGTAFINGNLITTSDSGKYKDIKDCTYKADEKEKRERTERIWLGTIKGAYLLNFSNGNTASDKKWVVKHTTIPEKSKTNLSEPRIQEVVTILEESTTQYKIIPRGHTNEGWIDKEYIKEICKYEKEE